MHLFCLPLTKNGYGFAVSVFFDKKRDSKTWLQISRAAARLAEIWEKAPGELSIARGGSHPLRLLKSSYHA